MADRRQCARTRLVADECHGRGRLKIQLEAIELLPFVCVMLDGASERGERLRKCDSD
jgi:hypothetical protein